MEHAGYPEPRRRGTARFAPWSAANGGLGGIMALRPWISISGGIFIFGARLYAAQDEERSAPAQKITAC